MFFSDFNVLFKRFGPLFARQRQQKLVTLLQQTWFHGTINQQQAALTLGDQSGVFLVRFSSDPGQFTFSFVDKRGDVMNVRFQRWPTREMCMSFLKNKGLTGIPHPGPTEFSHIFPSQSTPVPSSKNAYLVSADE